MLCVDVGTYLAIHRTIKKDGFFSKLLKAYPNDTNSSTTAASQVDLLLGFQVQKDQLVPSYVHAGTAVQELQVGPLFAVITKGMSAEKLLRKRSETM